MIGTDPHDTFENAISGPALARTYGTEAKDLPANHPAWIKVGKTTGRLATMLGLMNGVELVVPCGGVGAGASDYYGSHLRNMMTTYNKYANAAQQKFTPDIIPVPAEEAQVFEMYGTEGVMRDFATRDSFSR